MMRHAFLRLLLVLVLCLGCTAVVTAAPYVYTSLPFTGSVSIIDPLTNTLVPQSPVPVCAGIAGLAATPDGTRVYIACLNSPFVYVIETATHTVTATVSLPPGSRSQEIVIAPNGLKAYVVIQDSNAVGVIDTSTNTLIPPVIGGFNSPHGIAIMPNGSKAYVTNHGVNASGSTVSVIDLTLATPAIVATVQVGQAPIGVVVSPDNTKAYVGHKGGISIIRTADDIVTTTVLFLGTGHLAISPNGAEVWASEASQGLAVINTSDNSIALFSHKVDVMGFTSDGTKLYSTTENNSVLVINAFSKALITAVANSSNGGYSHLTVTPGSLSLPPVFSCVGFEPPMDNEVVKVKKNRVLPLKAQLFENNTPIIGGDINALPVIQVLFNSGVGPAIDVTNEALSAGQGTPGNEFVFSGSKWQFNLETKNYTAAGTYTITMVSGDTSEYTIDPTCTGVFVIE